MPERGEEYGNYRKYEANSVKEVNDLGLNETGEDKFRKNYNSLMA
jgi:hypothetical protein